MSKRRAPTIADLATGAAGGRRVVLSCGSLDGAFLAALQRVQLAPLGDQVSTWGEGVTPSKQGGNDDQNKTT